MKDRRSCSPTWTSFMAMAISARHGRREYCGRRARAVGLCRQPSTGPKCSLHRARELHDDLLELGIARVIGRREDDGVADDAVDVAGAGIADETVSECPLSDVEAQSPFRGKGRARDCVAHELNADEKAAAAHIAHLLESGERAAHAILKSCAHTPDPLEQSVA